jgi:hypothetical protein
MPKRTEGFALALDRRGTSKSSSNKALEAIQRVNDLHIIPSLDRMARSSIS